MLRGVAALRLEMEAVRAELGGDRQRAHDLGVKARQLMRRAFAELEQLEETAEAGR
jgi:hypothetical protein